jgi:F0F1-type ATP synthase membrane subunit b/b'
MRDVRGATDAALKQLAEQSANLAVDLAGRIVRQRINPEEENRLVRDALAKMPNGAPSNN